MMLNCSSIQSPTTSFTICFVCYANTKSWYHELFGTNGTWTFGSAHCLFGPNTLGPDVAVYGTAGMSCNAVTANTPCILIYIS